MLNLFKMLWRMFVRIFVILYAGFFCSFMSMIIEVLFGASVFIFYRLLTRTGDVVDLTVTLEMDRFLMGCLLGSSLTLGFVAAVIQIFRPWLGWWIAHQ